MLYTVIDLVIAAIAIYFAIDAYMAYKGAAGTMVQRMLAAGKQSATILWSRFVVMVTAMTGALAWVADMAGQPSIAQAIQAAVKPQYVAMVTVAIAVIAELARRRTLATPPAA
jgi:hypothetical protein